MSDKKGFWDSEAGGWMVIVACLLLLTLCDLTCECAKKIRAERKAIERELKD